jgi:hypothetical protein
MKTPYVLQNSNGDAQAISCTLISSRNRPPVRGFLVLEKHMNLILVPSETKKIKEKTRLAL